MITVWLLAVVFTAGFLWGFFFIPWILVYFRRKQPLKSGRCPCCGSCIH